MSHKQTKGKKLKLYLSNKQENRMKLASHEKRLKLCSPNKQKEKDEITFKREKTKIKQRKEGLKLLSNNKQDAVEAAFFLTSRKRGWNCFQARINHFGQEEAEIMFVWKTKRKKD